MQELKIFGSDNSKEQSSLVRLLMLVQNEAGEIVARGLTQSENHDESGAILETLVHKVNHESDDEMVCVCDNAVQTRNLITKVFGGRVATKQDLYSALQRM